MVVKIKESFAKELLAGKMVFDYLRISCNDGLLVVEDDRGYHYGTQMKDESFVLDDSDFVVFCKVTPVVNAATLWALA
jgi:hypothetical protein